MPEFRDADDVPAQQRLLQPTAELPPVAAVDREPSAGSLADGPPIDTRYDYDRPRRSRGAGCLFWLAGLIALVLVVGIGAKVTGLLPKIHNPFEKKTTDKSQPTLLLSIQDLSRFEAAAGNFQVIVDQKDTVKYIPDFIYSNRVLFVAAGSVDAYVDFSRIASDDIKADVNAKTVEIHLPAPQLDDVNLDQDKTYVYDESQGVANKVHDFFSNDPNKMQRFYQLGEQRIAQAAKDSDLSERAAENTKKMLDQLLRSVGYTTITIAIASP
jgi:hypothetical protein